MKRKRNQGFFYSTHFQRLFFSYAFCALFSLFLTLLFLEYHGGNLPCFLQIGIPLTVFLFLTLIFYLLSNKRYLSELKKLDIFLADESRKNPQWSSASSHLLPHLTENIRAQVHREYAGQLLKKQTTLSALQSQINPHFLYNTLDSIRGQALEYHVPEIAEMTEALSSFFRYSVSGTGTMILLREELKNVETYFSIQQYRFENRFTLDINYPTPSILDYYLPKFTLQPIVENCIYHGLENKSGPGQITVRILTTSSRLLISISDNGIGISPEKILKIQSFLNAASTDANDASHKEHTGIALTNINRRLKLMCGETYGLLISSQLGVGTEVEIILPLIDSISRQEEF